MVEEPTACPHHYFCDLVCISILCPKATAILVLTWKQCTLMILSISQDESNIF